MMMKKTALCLMAVVTVTFGANAQTKTPIAMGAKKPIAKPTVSKTVVTAPLMKTGLDSFSYAVGVNIGTSMKEQGITSLNGSLMQKAIDDVLNYLCSVAGKNEIFYLDHREIKVVSPRN